MKFTDNTLNWTNEPAKYSINDNEIIITTSPHTDLWQKTYYKFINDNAPMLQTETDEKYFSFIVKASFNTSHRFDQCGIIVYLDSENWIKASIEYENQTFQNLGSVVTNLGYSDWATSNILADIKEIWYRLSRRENDFKIEYSFNGAAYNQMRICHLHKADNKISFGIYACSPEDSSFKAVFSEMNIVECLWYAHDGQQPDNNLL